MKKLIAAILTVSIVLSGVFLAAMPAAADPYSAPLVGSVNANWEEGALSIQGSVPGAAYQGNVNIYNNYVSIGSGRIGFARLNANDTLTNLGRTNGAGDNGVASHAFAFKSAGSLPWQNTVPFAFGTKGGRDTIWTPKFWNQGILTVYMAQFSTDNGKGDEDSTVGIIEVGDFRAIDGDAGVSGVNRPNKVVFQKFNGTSWQQIGRTNGGSDDGNLESFTVLTVRTGHTLDGAGKIVNVNTAVPIAKIERSGGIFRLSMPIYGNNIGTQTMTTLP